MIFTFGLDFFAGKLASAEITNPKKNIARGWSVDGRQRPGSFLLQLQSQLPISHRNQRVDMDPHVVMTLDVDR